MIIIDRLRHFSFSRRFVLRAACVFVVASVLSGCDEARTDRIGLAREIRSLLADSRTFSAEEVGCIRKAARSFSEGGSGEEVFLLYANATSGRLLLIKAAGYWSHIKAVRFLYRPTGTKHFTFVDVPISETYGYPGTVQNEPRLYDIFYVVSFDDVDDISVTSSDDHGTIHLPAGMTSSGGELRAQLITDTGEFTRELEVHIHASDSRQSE